MTKQEFIEKFSLLEDFESKAAAARAVEYAITIIKDEVAKGNEVVISGLGKFYPQKQAGRSGTSPMTGKQYSTPDKIVPKFKAAKAFKDVVKG